MEKKISESSNKTLCQPNAPIFDGLDTGVGLNPRRVQSPEGLPSIRSIVAPVDLLEALPRLNTFPETKNFGRSYQNARSPDRSKLSTGIPDLSAVRSASDEELWDMPTPFQNPSSRALQSSRQRQPLTSESYPISYVEVPPPFVRSWSVTQSAASPPNAFSTVAPNFTSLPTYSVAEMLRSLPAAMAPKSRLSENQSQTATSDAAIRCQPSIHQQQPSSSNVLQSKNVSQLAGRGDETSCYKSDNATVTSTRLPCASSLLRLYERSYRIPTEGQAKYEKYVSVIESLDGLSSGKYQKGILRVSPGSSDEAYITNTQKDAPDFLVADRKNRNRSIHGDTVVFETLDVSQWRPIDNPFEAIDSKLTSKESARKDRGELRPTVKIVHVLEFGGKGRLYVALLRANRTMTSQASEQQKHLLVTANDKFIRAVPLDKRIPWILIPVSHVCPFTSVPGHLQESSCYRIRIESWPETSFLPLGQIVEFVGNLGDFDTEEKIAMVDNELEDHLLSFDAPVEEEAQHIVDTIQRQFHHEIENRVDLRHNLRVMTIDPKTAKDLDDAISIEMDDSVNPSEVRIGVHIADVTHFVKPMSLIDQEAKKRCTTIYLPRSNFPMLPRSLCDNLCSLNPNEDKLTFSVIFQLKLDGSLSDTKSPWFGKTVIRSCCRFNYDETQVILNKFHSLHSTTPDFEGSSTNEQADRFLLNQQMDSLDHPEISCGHQWAELWRDIVLLESLTQGIRERRISDGSLPLRKSKLIADFEYLFETHPVEEDEEHHHSSQTSHHLIEELMLLANKLVAEKMMSSTTLSDHAVLRYHPKPKTKEIVKLHNYLESYGFEPDFSSSRTTKLFFDSLADMNPLLSNTVQHLFLITMNKADYGVASYLPDFHHYALNFPLYTHFTSPIRRYADILVHRLLTTNLLLQCDTMKTSSRLIIDDDNGRQQLHAQCMRCNEKRLQAKKASEDCSISFFCLMLKERQVLYPILATVLCLQDASIHIYIPKLACQSRIFYNNCSSDETETQLNFIPLSLMKQVQIPISMTIQSDKVLTILWENLDDKSKQLKQIIKGFDIVPVYVVPLKKTPIQFATFLISPYDPHFMQSIQTSTYLVSEQKKFYLSELQKGIRRNYVDLQWVPARKESEATPSRSPNKNTDTKALARIIKFHTTRPIKKEE